MITKDEARKIIQHDYSWTWRRVPANVKLQIIDKVKQALRSEGIPEVGDDVLVWRMPNALRDCRHLTCKCSVDLMWLSSRALVACF